MTHTTTYIGIKFSRSPVWNNLSYSDSIDVKLEIFIEILITFYQVFFKYEGCKAPFYMSKCPKQIWLKLTNINYDW